MHKECNKSVVTQLTRAHIGAFALEACANISHVALVHVSQL